MQNSSRNSKQYPLNGVPSIGGGEAKRAVANITVQSPPVPPPVPPTSPTPDVDTDLDIDAGRLTTAVDAAAIDAVQLFSATTEGTTCRAQETVTSTSKARADASLEQQHGGMSLLTKEWWDTTPQVLVGQHTAGESTCC